MALTSQDLVLKLVAGMFGAAPGDFLDPLTGQLNSVGIEQLAIDLGNSSQFNALYPTTQGGHVLAGAFLAQIVPGYSPSNPQHLSALNWLAGQFDSGVPAGLVILHALEALYALPASDPTWGATRAHWDQVADAAARFDLAGLSGATLDVLKDAVQAPVFDSAEVNGTALVMHYTDLNGLHTPGPSTSAFDVRVGETVRTVSSVSVDASANTVTLTLTSAVVAGDVVTVAYTDPTSANDTAAIQDGVGNDAATLAAHAVTNTSPDTAGPVFASGTVNGSTVVLTYTDASKLDATNAPGVSAFTVMVGAIGDTVTKVAVDAAAKTVTLTLTTEVDDTQTVTVAYKDPTAGNDTAALQDALGNDAGTLEATKLTNTSPDTTSPVFKEATIDGDTLVMTYTEASSLEAFLVPGVSTFTVKANDVVDTVKSVTIDDVANTVTLTLNKAVAFGDTVKVAYTDPTSGDDIKALQDQFGNDAASLTATTVTNDTPDAAAPTFVSASVNGSTLVMKYDEATTLDASSTHEPQTGAFTVKANGSKIEVKDVAINASSKTVTLTLASAVADGQTVTLAYADENKGTNDTRAIQDAAGNDALSLDATTITNATADTTAPVYSVGTATVNGSSLQMTYTDLHNLDSSNVPDKGDFAVTVGGSLNPVTNVSISGKVVTLTLTTPAFNGQAASVVYTDHTGGNDTKAIQDLAGNDAASVTIATVTNATPLPPADTDGPVFGSAEVIGSSLVLHFTDASLLDGANEPTTTDFTVKIGASTVTVNSLEVDAGLRTVTLHLATAAIDGDIVKVSYTNPTTPDLPLQDASGNDAPTFGLKDVTNSTPDVTAPVLATAFVADKSLVLTYTELNNLDDSHVPAEGDFTVMVGALENVVLDVMVNAVANTVTLTLTDSVSVGATVTLDYDSSGSGNIQDAAGNDAVGLIAQIVNSGGA
ncbi:MAG: SwmB domain-containing protein [Pseudomonadota bacterium]